VPVVAGLERALPPSLGRVHPRWGSPYVALLVNAALSAALVGFTFSGSTINEAYQVLLKAGLVIQLIPFLYMFAALAGLPDTTASARVAGLVGLATTALGIAAAFIPTGEVDSVIVFEIKMALGVVVPIAVGLLFFARRTSRSAAAGTGGQLTLAKAEHEP
jgi:amino acid transporter